MKVLMATSPGHGRPNEDFVGAVPGAMVLLDGAGIPGTESICRHGVAWYSHTLGSTLLGLLSRQPDVGLARALAEAISHVADLHRDTCDLANPTSPQATVAIVRLHAGRVDHLVLADGFVVLDSSESGPTVVTDPREVDVRKECALPLRGLSSGSPEYERALPSVVGAIRARRNQPGGYWLAKDDPHAASEAVTGSTPLDSLTGAAVLSNGASRIVDPYRLAAWPDVLGLLRTKGPDEIVRRVRAAEASAGPSTSDSYSPDDVSVAYGDLGA
ncbi:MAG: hypothetical protein ACRDO4_12980 [Nocardioides sp.]